MRHLIRPVHEECERNGPVKVIVAGGKVLDKPLWVDPLPIERKKTERQTLRAAKAALVSYAAENVPRPGGLPCPDPRSACLQAQSRDQKSAFPQPFYMPQN